MEKTATENIDEKCGPAVQDMKSRSGKYWIKRQIKLYHLINQGKGRFKKMSLQTRKNMLVEMEKKDLGRSPTLEHDRKQFQEWYKEIFKTDYKLL